MTKEEVLKLALATLQSAPVKFRIDFDPYWIWYDKECVPAITQLKEELKQQDVAI